MIRYLLVLLSLLGCAGPAQYERGTMRPPARAPTFNPTTDSPNPYGHPRPEVPRSLHGRVLPQTPETRKEPGIWATGAPPATSSHFLGEPFPFPPDASLDAMAVNLRCGNLLDEAYAKTPAARAFVTRLTPVQRRCFAAVLHKGCAFEVLDGNERSRLDGQYDAESMRAVKAAAAMAEAFRVQACFPGIVMPPDAGPSIEDVFANLLTVLTRFDRGAR